MLENSFVKKLLSIVTEPVIRYKSRTEREEMLISLHEENMEAILHIRDTLKNMKEKTYGQSTLHLDH